MATAAVQHPQSPPSFPHQILTSTSNPPAPEPQDVATVLHYHKPNADGSPPAPTYVDRPETYDRPFEAHPVTVRDVAGREAEYSLDGNGFQFHKHTSTEKEFVDDEKIKAEYYPETEQLLKDV